MALCVRVCVQIVAGRRGYVLRRGGRRTVELTGTLGEKVTKITEDSSVSVLTCAFKHI